MWWFSIIKICFLHFFVLFFLQNNLTSCNNLTSTLDNLKILRYILFYILNPNNSLLIFFDNFLIHFLRNNCIITIINWICKNSFILLCRFLNKITFPYWSCFYVDFYYVFVVFFYFYFFNFLFLLFLLFGLIFNVFDFCKIYWEFLHYWDLRKYHLLPYSHDILFYLFAFVISQLHAYHSIFIIQPYKKCNPITFVHHLAHGFSKS